MNLGVAIPSSPGFIGTYQWLAVSALGLLGVARIEALAFGILMHATWYVPTLVIGGVLLLRRGVLAVRLQAAPAPLSTRMHNVPEPVAAPVALASPTLARLRVTSAVRDVLIVTGVSLALGLVRLGAPSFWVDEGHGWDELRREYSFYLEGYYWLFYSVMKPWTIIAGTSELAFRLPSVFAAMAAAALVVVLGRKLFDPRVGLVAGLLLATSPFIVRWSQQARAYTMVLALALVATLLLLRALERGTRGSWALYGLSLAIVIVWHPISGLLLVVPHLVLAWQRRERVMPHGLLAAVMVVVFGVPWAAQLSMRSAGDSTAFSWLEFPTLDVGLRAILGVSGALGVGLALALAGLWMLRRARETDAALWLAVWAFSPFVLSLTVSLAKPVYLDRYLIVAAPAFALLGGVALVRAARGVRVVLVGAVVAATAFGLAEWYSIGEGGNWRGEDYRSAIALTQQRPAEQVVPVPYWSWPTAEYYGAAVDDTVSADSVWILLWSEDDHELDVAEREPLGFGEYELVERRQFGWRLTAQRWERR